MDAQIPPPSSGEVSASDADGGVMPPPSRISAPPAHLNGEGFRWGAALERIAVPTLAMLASAVMFGLLLAIYARVDPLEAYALMYQGAFGSWFSWQNTLLRAAPLILTALCTALPSRLGLMIIGNEGALVLGGVA